MLPSSAPSPGWAGELLVPTWPPMTVSCVWRARPGDPYLSELTGQDVGLVPPLSHCFGGMSPASVA